MSFPNSSQHELLKARRKLVDAAKVVILDNHSTSGRLNAERIGKAIPADDENVAHRPATRRAKLSSELGVAPGELNNVINLLRAERDMTESCG